MVERPWKLFKNVYHLLVAIIGSVNIAVHSLLMSISSFTIFRPFHVEALSIGKLIMEKEESYYWNNNHVNDAAVVSDYCHTSGIVILCLQ